MKPVKIGIVGCFGRMGRSLTAATLDHPDAKFVGGTEIANHPQMNKMINHPDTNESSGITLSSDAEDLFEAADVILDFTCPTATMFHASLAAKHSVALVVGTTGLSKEEETTLKEAAQSATIVYASNYSVGVNLLFHLTQQASSILGDDFDIEISEVHHRDKLDAPSGTALGLGRSAATGRQKKLENIELGERSGIGSARPKGGIGFTSLRGGNIAGEHTVNFIADDERVELTHKAGNRAIFARGAVTAAIWASANTNGIYDMSDVLGLK